MAITKDSFPQTANRVDLAVAFREGRSVVPDTSYKMLLMSENSNSNAKEVVFYGSKGRLRRFRGERQSQSFEEYKYFARLDDWEMTHDFSRNLIADDQSGGLLERKIRSFGTDIENSLEEETLVYLRQGVSKLGFDKANLFDFSHAYVNSSGVTVTDFTQSNMDLSNIGITTNSIEAAQFHFANLKDDKGKQFKGKMTHAMVRRGSQNAFRAKEIVNSTFAPSPTVNDNTINVLADFSVIEVDYGIGVSEWIALDLSSSENLPILALEHASAPGMNNMEFTALTDPGDTEQTYRTNNYSVGVYGRFDWNVGDWRSAYLFGSSSTVVPTAGPDFESQQYGDPNA